MLIISGLLVIVALTAATGYFVAREFDVAATMLLPAGVIEPVEQLPLGATPEDLRPRGRTPQPPLWTITVAGADRAR